MNLHTISWFSSLFLILLHGSSDTPDTFYDSCGATFTCGDAVAGIGFPFRGTDAPLYCGHPSLTLACDHQTNITNINIVGTKYRVLAIDQAADKMTVAREDIMDENCPREKVNTTLDHSVFDFDSSCKNFTFFYGCPDVFPDLSHITCGKETVYVLPGTMGPEVCESSVIVPGTWDEAGGPLNTGQMNTTELDRAIHRGFQIKWKVDSEGCGGCRESKGRCGYSWETNRSVCYCPDPPYIADRTCNIVEGASQTPDMAASPKGDNRSKSKRNVTIGLFIAGAVVAGAGLGWLIFFCRQKRKMRVASSSSSHIASKEIAVSPSRKVLLSLPSDNFTRSIPSFPSLKSDLGRGSSYFGVKVFSYSELELATNNFDPSRELGDGGFGTVYYGVLPDGHIVAVKRLYENNFKRAEQFMNEVEILTRLRHKHLVTLFGCTSRQSRELLLVYEYISNGTVADHLHGKRAKSGLLSWPVRLNIAVETADALAYLHRSGIIHRDVKTNNLLLDNDFHIKVADFGLSRLFPCNVTHVSTAPQGTPGYVDPEYYQCYHLTEKSDVYSFGVVLVELISSLQAVDTNRHRHDINLSNMAVNKIQNRMLHELVDSSLGFETNSSLRRMVTLVAELAFRCLQQERDMRPSMEEVLEALRGIQNEDLNALKVEIVDMTMDDQDAGLLKGSVTPGSQDSVQ